MLTPGVKTSIFLCIQKPFLMDKIGDNGKFHVHSITDLVQQLSTAGRFYPHAKSLPRSVYKHGVIRTCTDIYLEMMVVGNKLVSH